MTKTAEMLTAARAFTATIGGHREHVERGERVAADHPLVKAAPRGAWEPFTVEQECAFRAAAVADINGPDRDEQHAYRSASVKREVEQDRFWQGVTRMLEPAVDPEARREQNFYDTAQRQIEQADLDRLEQETDQFRELWAGRLPADG